MLFPTLFVARRSGATLALLLVGSSLISWQSCHAGLTSGGLAEVSLGDLNDQPVGVNQGDGGTAPSGSAADSTSGAVTGSTGSVSTIPSGSGPGEGGVTGAVTVTPRKRSRQNNGNFGPGNSGGGGGSGTGGPSASNGLATALSALQSAGGVSLPATGGSSSSLGGSAPLLDSSVPGSSASNPLLPSSVNGGSYGFTYTVTPGGLGTSAAPLFVDPPLATGYLITVNSGPKILTVTDTTAPNLLSNTTTLTVTFDGHTGTFAPGGTFDFGAVEPGGVTQFTLTGISPLDVSANPSGEFMTSFTFAPNGGIEGGQITETVLAPEPASLTLWAAGAFCLLGWRHQRGKRPHAS